jgi:hypothetical protein
MDDALPFSAEVGIYSLCHCVPTSSGAHPASYRMGMGALISGVKRPRREAGHSPSCNAEVRKALSCASSPPVRLHGVLLRYRDNFIFSSPSYTTLKSGVLT